MRTLITLLSFLLLQMASIPIYAGFTADKRVVTINDDPKSLSSVFSRKSIRYIEKAKNYSSAFSNQGFQPKSIRLANNQGGNIVLLYDHSLPDSIQTAFYAAKKLWEAKLPTRQSILISVRFEKLESDISMIADVPCLEGSDLKGCPSALASQIDNIQYGSVSYPDGYIILNSKINWNCRFSHESTSEYNIPTMMLRGTARCLGFGSSILEESDNKDNFFFPFECPSYFDKLLYNGHIALSDLNEGSADMANFIKSDNVKAHTQAHSYDIYSPKEFIQDASLCYFKDDYSLMSYQIGCGNIDLFIDDRTSDILQSIGWNVSSSSLRIQCNDISDNGIGSSYSSHVFSLSKGKENITDYNWRFLLKDKHGNYTQISNGTYQTFTISAIPSPDDYFVNINGDLEGRIECDYSINGSKGTAVPFALALELKPCINSIDNIRIVNNGQYEFTALFNVHYAGADYVTIEVEEEYNTTLRNYRFNEPYIAHVATGNISNLYDSWITIVVSNKYGSDYKTLEYPATWGTNTIHDSQKPSTSHISTTQEIENIQLYDANGTIVFNGPLSDFSDRIYKPGFYIKKETYGNGQTKISKMLLHR